MEVVLNPSLSDYKGRRVVVLGASGFIGRWVARKLCEQEAYLSLIVRDRALAEQIFKRYQIRGEIYEIDLRNHTRLRLLLQEQKPSITFNLAGYGVDRSERDETLAYQLNTYLIGVLCEAIAPIRDATWTGQDIVHAGSAMEYGDVGGDLSEGTPPNPVDLYGKSKLAGTLAFRKACQVFGLKGITVRMFTIYGPGELPERLLPSLMRIALTGDSLPMTPGQQKRDFAYVEDTALGLILLGLAKAIPGEIVNLATGNLTSIRDFVNIAAGELNIHPHQLLFGALPGRIEEMVHDPVTNDRLKRLTSWSPATSIEEGIRQTMIFEYGYIPGG